MVLGGVLGGARKNREFNLKKHLFIVLDPEMSRTTTSEPPI